MISRRAFFAGLVAAAVATPVVAQERTVCWGNKTLRYDPLKLAEKLRRNSEYGYLSHHRTKYYIDQDGMVVLISRDLGLDLMSLQHVNREYYAESGTGRGVYAVVFK